MANRRRDIRLHHRIVLASRLLFSRPFTVLVARWLFNGLRNGANVACLKRQRGRKIRSHAWNKIRGALTGIIIVIKKISNQRTPCVLKFYIFHYYLIFRFFIYLLK